MNPAIIVREVLHLPASDRAELIHKLLLCLGTYPSLKLNRHGLAGQSGRNRSGIARRIPAEDVSCKVRALLLR
jgi:hypothetical protein